MNEEELARNSVATDYAVHDLNVDPRLPYEDNSFDVVTNAVSVDCASLTVDLELPASLATLAQGMTLGFGSDRSCQWCPQVDHSTPLRPNFTFSAQASSRSGGFPAHA